MLTEYLKSVFGDDFNIKIENADIDVPIYIRELYSLYKLTLIQNEYIILQPKQKIPAIVNLRKHMEMVSKLSGLPVILCAEDITPRLRSRLIENKIQFIIPGKQLFIPYSGIALNERYTPIYEKRERFSAVGQVLFIALCYNRKLSDNSYTKIAIQLGIDKMSVSRAARELQGFGIINVTKTGNSKFIELDAYGKELFNKGKPFLITPVQKTILTYEDNVKVKLCSGLSALSASTMLSENTKTFAVIKSMRNNIEILPTEYSGEEGICRLEMWKYNPELFADKGIVDFISLYASLKNSTDERVQIALSEMEENYQW